jgi:hypothetical protein
MDEPIGLTGTDPSIAAHALGSYLESLTRHRPTTEESNEGNLRSIDRKGRSGTTRRRTKQRGRYSEAKMQRGCCLLRRKMSIEILFHQRQFPDLIYQL